jgi:hypothetical protein
MNHSGGNQVVISSHQESSVHLANLLLRWQPVHVARDDDGGTARDPGARDGDLDPLVLVMDEDWVPVEGRKQAGPQRPSEAIRGHQRQLEAIRGQQART